MKRSHIVPALVLLAICAAASGQGVSKAAYQGGFLVSGQAGASLTFTKAPELDAQQSALSVTFAPRLLYFVVDGLGVGVEGNVNYYSLSGSHITGLAVGPRVAYYLVQTDKKYPRTSCLTSYLGPGWWMPFVGVTGEYLSNRFDSGGEVSTSSGWLARVGIGMSPLIGDRGTMPIEVGYEMQNIKSAPSTSRVYLEIGFGAFLFTD
jgi:hypothetical protein